MRPCAHSLWTRRNSGIERPHGKHRAGENREPGGDRRRHFQRKNESETCVRGWPLVRDPRRSAAGESRTTKSPQAMIKAAARSRARSKGWADEAREFTESGAGFRGRAVTAAAPIATRAQNPGTILDPERDGDDGDARKHRARLHFDSRRENRGGGNGSEGAGRRDGD